MGLGRVFNRKFVLYFYICLSCSFWPFASDCYLFAIGFCNDFLPSEVLSKGSQRKVQPSLVWFKNGFISSGPNGLNPLVLIGENMQGGYLVFLPLFVLTLLVCWT